MISFPTQISQCLWSPNFLLFPCILYSAPTNNKTKAKCTAQYKINRKDDRFLYLCTCSNLIISHLIFFFYLKIFYTYDCFMWVCICVPHAFSGAYRDRNRACDPSKPELQLVVSLHVDTDYETNVLYPGSVVTEPSLQCHF